MGQFLRRTNVWEGPLTTSKPFERMSQYFEQNNANVFRTDMQTIQTVCRMLCTDFLGIRTDDKWFTPSNG